MAAAVRFSQYYQAVFFPVSLVVRLDQVDDSEAFLPLRARLPHGGMLRHDAPIGPKPAVGDWACTWGHTYTQCKCHLPVVLSGDDVRPRPRSHCACAV